MTETTSFDIPTVTDTTTLDIQYIYNKYQEKLSHYEDLKLNPRSKRALGLITEIHRYAADLYKAGHISHNAFKYVNDEYNKVLDEFPSVRESRNRMAKMLAAQRSHSAKN